MALSQLKQINIKKRAGPVQSRSSPPAIVPRAASQLHHRSLSHSHSHPPMPPVRLRPSTLHQPSARAASHHRVPQQPRQQPAPVSVVHSRRRARELSFGAQNNDGPHPPKRSRQNFLLQSGSEQDYEQENDNPDSQQQQQPKSSPSFMSGSRKWVFIFILFFIF